jgi:hypothetical protein
MDFRKILKGKRNNKLITGYSSLNLKIHSFDTNIANNTEVEGQFDEFLGDRIVFKAVYNPNTKELISFNITAKKPKGTGLL